jgi:tRNA(adenine34) deaminase
MLDDDYYMRVALRQAERAFEEDEVPIGAVVACEGQIIGKGYNQTERLQDPTAHAEMLAITAACSYLGSKYLQDCVLYVTVEPCLMCAGALRWAQLSRVVVGAPEPKTGFLRLEADILHPKTLLSKGVLEEECVALMKEFFRKKRR